MFFLTITWLFDQTITIISVIWRLSLLPSGSGKIWLGMADKLCRVWAESFMSYIVSNYSLYPWQLFEMFLPFQMSYLKQCSENSPKSMGRTLVSMESRMGHLKIFLFPIVSVVQWKCHFSFTIEYSISHFCVYRFHCLAICYFLNRVRSIKKSFFTQNRKRLTVINFNHHHLWYFSNWWSKMWLHFGSSILDHHFDEDYRSWRLELITIYVNFMFA